MQTPLQLLVEFNWVDGARGILLRLHQPQLHLQRHLQKPALLPTILSLWVPHLDLSAPLSPTGLCLCLRASCLGTVQSCFQAFHHNCGYFD